MSDFPDGSPITHPTRLLMALISIVNPLLDPDISGFTDNPCHPPILSLAQVLQPFCQLWSKLAFIESDLDAFGPSIGVQARYKRLHLCSNHVYLFSPS